MNRLEQLWAWYKETPQDPFLLYALATEYKNTDPQQALQCFEQLLAQHPHYTATYYHLAALYVEFGKRTDALKVYQEGLKICQQQKDAHALRELQRAYKAFQDEEEDF